MCMNKLQIITLECLYSAITEGKKEQKEATEASGVYEITLLFTWNISVERTVVLILVSVSPVWWWNNISNFGQVRSN